jgi:hypothetical protein
MELIVSAWFNEPNINFKFSHKVDLYIRDEIKNNILEPLGLLDAFPDKYLTLNVTTESDRTKLKVHIAPKWSKRTKHRTHGLWFPYRPIIDSEYPLREYLNYFMDSLKVVFKEFDVTHEQLQLVRANCEREILNNDEYVRPQSEIDEEIDEVSSAKQFAKDMGFE